VALVESDPMMATFGEFDISSGPHPAQVDDIGLGSEGQSQLTVARADASVTGPRLDPTHGVVGQVASGDRASDDVKVQFVEDVFFQEDQIEAQSVAHGSPAGSDRQVSDRRGLRHRISILVQPPDHRFDPLVFCRLWLRLGKGRAQISCAGAAPAEDDVIDLTHLNVHRLCPSASRVYQKQAPAPCDVGGTGFCSWRNRSENLIRSMIRSKNRGFLLGHPA